MNSGHRSKLKVVLALTWVKCARIACVKSAGLRAQANYDDYLFVAPNTNF